MIFNRSLIFFKEQIGASKKNQLLPHLHVYQTRLQTLHPHLQEKAPTHLWIVLTPEGMGKE
jgi:hypothetical protein